MQTPDTQWTALILAGQRPGIDPLAAHFGVEYKALVHVAGEPMLTHVVRTLNNVLAINQTIVLAQKTGVFAAAIAAGGNAATAATQSAISTSILAIVSQPGFHWPVLITTADHPLLTREMVDEFLSATPGCDVAVAMVERGTMMAQFPDAKRTWLKFSDGAWSGANLFALNSPKAMAALELWAAAERDRKKPWRLFMHFGLGLAFRAITRTIGLGDALGRAGSRFGLSVRLVPMRDAVAAIDVDKVFDHTQAEQILAQRVTLVPRVNSD